MLEHMIIQSVGMGRASGLEMGGGRADRNYTADFY